MGVHAEKQIDITFTQSKESQETLDLINKAREGNDFAYEELFNKYKRLFNGNFLQNHLNFNFYKTVTEQDREDIHSILNVIFCECVKSYNAEKCTFMTYLVWMLFWKFRTYYLREKMIPVSNGRKSKEVAEMIKKTGVDLTDKLEDVISDVSQEPSVSFTVGDEDYSLPVPVFVNHYLLDRIDEVVPEKSRALYKYYLNAVREIGPGAYTVTAKKFGMRVGSVHYFVKKCNASLVKSLKIKNLRI